MSLRLMKWRGKELNTLSSQMPPRTFCSKQRWTPSESTIKWPSQVPGGQRMAYGHFSLPPTYCPEVCSPRILWQGYLHVLQISRQSDCRTKLYQNLRSSFTCSVSCVPFCTEYVQPKDCMEDNRQCSVAQSCLALCDPTDCSPPGSSVCGISQARMLEWVAISFSRGSSRPRD